jgi:hypothetical protein
LSLLEGAVAIGLAIPAMRAYGLVGACVVMALGAVACRGVATLVYGCRVVGIRVRSYVRQVLLPPLAVAVCATAVAACIAKLWPPEGWIRLVAHGLILTVVYTALVVFFVVGPVETKTRGLVVLRTLSARLRSAP